MSDPISSLDVQMKLVPVRARKKLTEKQRFDYEQRREKFIRWLSTFGKNPDAVEGYADSTVKRTAYRACAFEQWVWEERGEYVPRPTRDDLDDYVEHIAYRDVSQAHKGRIVSTLKRYWRWREYEYDDQEWEPEHAFPTSNRPTQPRDYLTQEERQEIRQVALEYGTLPWYQQWGRERRESMRPYVADRLDKEPDELTRDDWNGLESWKFTSLVWTSLDGGLRPVEVQRATPEWVDVENAVLRIPADESAKNRDNWTVSIREDTAAALGEWLKERAHRLRYEGRDALWLTQKENTYSSRTLGRLIRRLCDKAGIDHENRRMTWYSIRHSVGTYMAREEGLAAAQAQLRHKSIKTTMRYDNAPPDDRRDALDRMG